MKFFVLLVLLLSPSAALGFCGCFVPRASVAKDLAANLYNDATQVVLMRDGNQTVLTMQNSYVGPPEDFAMVVPVPQLLKVENVKTLDKAIFRKIEQLSAPRLVEYWEQNPCGRDRPAPPLDILRGPSKSQDWQGSVAVRAEFVVGEYEIVMLDTNDSAALERWLKANNYRIPDGADAYLKPYVEAGMYFFVAKVDAQKVKFEGGKAALSPLRFNYQSNEFSLPIRLGMINSSGSQDLLIYILAMNQRYEVANRPNITIPTDTSVSDAARYDFSGFYEALFDRAIEQNPGAVVTEYVWHASGCDPCPPGDGVVLSPEELVTLGATVSNADPRLWILTRLHARYTADNVGTDLVFRKADPLVGGIGSRAAGETAVSASLANQFQSRYVIRHEWEGEPTCQDPVFGRWGLPPSPFEMDEVKRVVLLRIRRDALSAQGKERNLATADDPMTEAEAAAVAAQWRQEFGVSEKPPVTRAPSVALSANTRPADKKNQHTPALESLVREPILGLTPQVPLRFPISRRPSDTTPVVLDRGPQTAAQTAPATTPASGCSTATGGTWVMLMLVGFFRRRRN
ncbi:MAG: DUF2330 domain-containing protein [bacterium]